MDITPVIQKKLKDKEKCVASIEAGLVEGWVKTSRVLALVGKEGEYGLLVFKTTRSPCVSPTDLSIEQALPINLEFKCAVDTSAPRTIGSDVPVKITGKRAQLIFEVPYGTRSNSFMTEMKRAMDVEAQTAGFGLPSEFTWLDKYSPAPRNSSGTLDMFDPLKQAGPQQPSQNLNPNSVDSTADGSNPMLGFEDNFTDGVTLDDADGGGRRDLKISDNDSASFTSSITSSLSKSLDDLNDLPVSKQHFGVATKPVGSARDVYIQVHMSNRDEEFTHKKQLKVFCGTWNVNGQPASVSIKPWLSYDEEPPDIYAIGFQELDLSKEAFIFNDSNRQDDWFKQVCSALHPEAKYRKVRLIRLVGIMLVVFIKDDLVAHINDIDAAYVGTGIMGVMGNKGGVAVRFSIYNSTVCFISSHLAAHVEEYERRNQDFRDINSRLRFAKFDPPLSIVEHDMIFWLGDLNYRLSELDAETVKNLCKSQDFETILKYDQLFRQINAKKVFLGYKEGDIKFIPTYKYDPGTDKWDTSEKCRAPAWCDRVLWKGDGIDQVAYRSHHVLRISDHKPVSAVFNVYAKVIDTAKYKRVYEDVMKKLDRLENEFLPQVSLDRVELHFKDVMFIEPQCQHITIANTGQVPVQFEFINKLDDDSYCKPWLLIRPPKRFIMPGESCEVEFEVYVNKDTAPKLNAGDDKIEDILVLHLDGGKDFFVSVSGNFLPSCFGSSLEALVHMYGVIRDVPTAQLIDLSHYTPTSEPASSDHDQPLDIPKEIWRLVDHLYNYGMSQEDLFQQPGLHSEIQQIRDSLDTGVPEDIPGGIHSVSESLLIFIEALPEPVIVYSLYQRCLDNSHSFIASKQLVSMLPTCHRNTFNYICAFLRKLLEFNQYNNLEPKFLASLFSAVMLRAPPTDKRDNPSVANKRATNIQILEKKKATFLYHFLVNEDAVVTPFGT
ncbi:type II inositol 1,4,5-trisphosphate 5-phosphatase-like isoform X2 [Lineus longissimus]|uniref:type II inositol 1,4,5-trisphosphate 5-phosphatase-like isoform X2 n=1 Tax=Lineus longissimus TaxID=88925 RepID=UPI00315D66B9